MLPLLSTLLYILFVLSAIVLVVVILLQEGKGGGLTGALGTEGQQTFGVGTKGINQFTGWTCAVFLICALAIHMVNRAETGSSVVQSSPALSTPPADTNTATPPAAPADAGGSTPPAVPAEEPKK
ncbi:MAG: preprotein translocase subunit SecG [Planctomycetes bacterium]|nr:preprotein translocase subunit SecG [Planctomycetota bacterium]